MLCLECGYLNEADARVCARCRVKLPDRNIEIPTLTDHLDLLVSSARKIRDYQMSSGEFTDLLQRLNTLFTDALVEIGRMEIPEDDKMELAEEIESGTRGIKLFIEALKEMNCYITSRNPLYLDRGILMAQDANKRLNDALKMNWQGFRMLQETTEEFLRTQTYY